MKQDNSDVRERLRIKIEKEPGWGTDGAPNHTVVLTVILLWDNEEIDRSDVTIDL